MEKVNKTNLLVWTVIVFGALLFILKCIEAVI